MSLLSPRASRVVLTLPVLVLTVFSSQVGVNASTPSNRAAALPSIIKSAPASVLVNAKGMTLYVFAADKKNTSNCYDTSSFKCATFWPPLLLPTHYVMHNSPGNSVWGVAMRKDGARQLSYYGAPLYTWIKDKKPGDMTGQGVAGVWWIVTG
jgi:predicted lipoprotein with Yx(FWY)xxD motif